MILVLEEKKFSFCRIILLTMEAIFRFLERTDILSAFFDNILFLKFEKKGWSNYFLNLNTLTPIICIPSLGRKYLLTLAHF
jgi:hypothetical protein